MSTINIGNNAIRIVGTEHDFDPAYGYTTVHIYEGTESALLTMAAGFGAAGQKASVAQHNGPIYRMRVTLAKHQPNTQEQPIDIYEWDTDLAQESIWSNPWVIWEAGAGDMEAGGLITELWKEEFKSPLKDNTAPHNTEFINLQLELYTLLHRGQEAVEVERKVLRRTRTYSLRFGPRQVVTAVPLIYTSARLISEFDIPSVIASQFPATPAERPEYTTWGWKKRRDTSRILIGQQRVEENLEWVFAAWSDMPHRLVS